MLFTDKPRVPLGAGPSFPATQLGTCLFFSALRKIPCKQKTRRKEENTTQRHRGSACREIGLGTHSLTQPICPSFCLFLSLSFLFPSLSPDHTSNSISSCLPRRDEQITRHDAISLFPVFLIVPLFSYSWPRYDKLPPFFRRSIVYRDMSSITSWFSYA
jgi:hypothetical protein